MSKVYCQNDLCKYYTKSRIYKNYGRCNKQEVFMTWQCQDEDEVTAHNCECLNSQQEREGIEL